MPLVYVPVFMPVPGCFDYSGLVVQFDIRYVYTMEFYAAERKKELIPFAMAWMELESIMLSEISQAVRDKYHMISPLTGT